jgi:hypothetical protein
MKKIFLAVAASLAVTAASAQSEAASSTGRAFETMAGGAIQNYFPIDAFAGLEACRVLDQVNIRAWTLPEAQAHAAPCLEAVGRRFSARVEAETGFLATDAAGKPSQPGLLIKADVLPGSMSHRDLVVSLEKRGGRLLGQPVRLIARGEIAPEAVSAVQESLKRCIVVDVVRPIGSGEDFVKYYGRCLTADPSLQLIAVRPGAGLTVTMQTRQTSPVAVDSLNGYVTVNAGAGPVRVMVVAYGANYSLP